MADTPAPSSTWDPSKPIHLGFLTVRTEGTGYVGGYLVTNLFGRPLEFRISSAVQPNRVHEILYGATLEPYICSELIGKTLVEKAGVPVQYLLTDNPLALDLRRSQSAPMLWLRSLGTPQESGDSTSITTRAVELKAAGAELPTSNTGHDRYFCHPEYLSDIPTLQDLLTHTKKSLDLTEPFLRIRDAIQEARKIGATRSAA